ncbi:MAG TPA: hypothetical protein VGG19_20695 [Tepidisphaeraceae bacterium]|jgi:hypothetical protein
MDTIPQVSTFSTTDIAIPRSVEINGQTWGIVGIRERLRAPGIVISQIAVPDYEQQTIWYDTQYCAELIQSCIKQAISFARTRASDWGKWNDIEAKPLKLTKNGRWRCPCCDKDFARRPNVYTHLLSVHHVPEKRAIEILYVTSKLDK